MNSRGLVTALTVGVLCISIFVNENVWSFKLVVPVEVKIAKLLMELAVCVITGN